MDLSKSLIVLKEAESPNHYNADSNAFGVHGINYLSCHWAVAAQSKFFDRFAQGLGLPTTNPIGISSCQRMERNE